MACQPAVEIADHAVGHGLTGIQFQCTLGEAPRTLAAGPTGEFQQGKSPPGIGAGSTHRLGATQVLLGLVEGRSFDLGAGKSDKGFRRNRVALERGPEVAPRRGHH